jgi:C-terminal region of MMR_HSR1 domain
VARSADAILIVLDAGKEGLQRHREILERELETVGIRLNQKAPDVTLSKRKAGGGVRFASTVPQPHLGPEPDKLVTQILREYKINSADVLAREEITVDQLVDVVQGNREYKPCLYLYNKIDTVTIEEIDQLARMPHSIVGSVQMGFNVGEPDEDDLLKQKMWKYLGLTRVYTKRKGANIRLLLAFLYGQTCFSNSSTLVLRYFFYFQDVPQIWSNLLYCRRLGKGPQSSHCVGTFPPRCCETLTTRSFGAPVPSTHRSVVECSTGWMTKTWFRS